MIGTLLSLAHSAFMALTGHKALLNERTDPRIDALAKRSAAKDAVRQATVRGDTRAQHEHLASLTAATTALLRAEIGHKRGAAR